MFDLAPAGKGDGTEHPLEATLPLESLARSEFIELRISRLLVERMSSVTYVTQEIWAMLKCIFIYLHMSLIKAWGIQAGATNP